MKSAHAIKLREFVIRVPLECFAIVGNYVFDFFSRRTSKPALAQLVVATVSTWASAIAVTLRCFVSTARASVLVPLGTVVP